ncbi:hemerythrin HHE cation binding domain-containing protein [Dactylonectria macrodidyma]|uniref:Hemerythrin HHE cation binding domain-containing protein n=1 Tax=Dactylonectria macrodidyma TaxID=307937 RepID=A0A9P9F4K3_9HYPO|nr:hemerythrin HHE cation binding domain-containing protein [Dactylonectria macrodidyma]
MSKLHWLEGPFALVHTPQYQEAEPDVFETYATGMALAHNMILRGLNSIYKQAPWVKPKESRDFLEYCNLWLQVITIHHGGEEKSLFPYIESAGVPNIMDINGAQHEPFHDGVNTMQDYVNAGLSGGSFDGSRMVEIIDGFGAPLREHLAEEIDTLVDLRKYGEKLSGLQAALDQEAKTNMGSVSISTGLVMLLLLHDKSWEDGKWANFPPRPCFRLLHPAQGVVSSPNLWRFAPCDNNALPQAQYARPPAV